MPSFSGQQGEVTTAIGMEVTNFPLRTLLLAHVSLHRRTYQKFEQCIIGYAKPAVAAEFYVATVDAIDASVVQILLRNAGNKFIGIEGVESLRRKKFAARSPDADTERRHCGEPPLF